MSLSFPLSVTLPSKQINRSFKKEKKKRLLINKKVKNFVPSQVLLKLHKLRFARVCYTIQCPSLRTVGQTERLMMNIELCEYFRIYITESFENKCKI